MTMPIKEDRVEPKPQEQKEVPPAEAPEEVRIDIDDPGDAVAVGPESVYAPPPKREDDVFADLPIRRRNKRALDALDFLTSQFGRIDFGDQPAPMPTVEQVERKRETPWDRYIKSVIEKKRLSEEDIQATMERRGMKREEAELFLASGPLYQEQDIRSVMAERNVSREEAEAFMQSGTAYRDPAMDPVSAVGGATGAVGWTTRSLAKVLVNDVLAVGEEYVLGQILYPTGIATATSDESVGSITAAIAGGVGLGITSTRALEQGAYSLLRKMGVEVDPGMVREVVDSALDMLKRQFGDEVLSGEPMEFDRWAKVYHDVDVEGVTHAEWQRSHPDLYEEYKMNVASMREEAPGGVVKDMTGEDKLADEQIGGALQFESRAKPVGDAGESEIVAPKEKTVFDAVGEKLADQTGAIRLFGEGKDLDVPKVRQSFSNGKPIPQDAIKQWRKEAKRVGLSDRESQRVVDSLLEYNRVVRTGQAVVMPDLDVSDKEMLIRLGVMNTPAVEGIRWNRTEMLWEDIASGKPISEIGALFSGGRDIVKIATKWRNRTPRVFLNVPITQGYMSKARPPEVQYPMIVTGNPHVTNFKRPDPSWDNYIVAIRIKPVLNGNAQAQRAVVDAINYANEIGAKVLVTTFRSKNPWLLARLTEIVPTDPKHPDFAQYWKRNPAPKPDDPKRWKDYSEYLPRGKKVSNALREAGWDIEKNIHGEGGTWWWPRSKELDPKIVKQIDPRTKLEYCDLLHKGCPTCRNCQKLTYPKAAGAPIAGVTDEPFCEHGCPQCFVRLGQSGVKGRGGVEIKQNLKQGGYGEADLGDLYPRTVSILQRVAQEPDARGRTDYASQFFGATRKPEKGLPIIDGDTQSDVAMSLYIDGKITANELANIQYEINAALAKSGEGPKESRLLAKLKETKGAIMVGPGKKARAEAGTEEEAYPRISDMEWELKFLRKENEELKFRDPKTGLFNEEGERHATADYLEQAGGRAGEVTFLRFDLDQFKLYNDTLGHAQGDVALKDLGDALRKVADGKTDIEVRGLASRRTGDEFGLVTMLPKEKVKEVSKQIQSYINEVLVEKGHAGKGHKAPLTVKAGEAYGIEKVPELHARAEEVLEARKNIAQGAARRGHEQQPQSLGAAAADPKKLANQLLEGIDQDIEGRVAAEFDARLKQLGGDPEAPLVDMKLADEADVDQILVRQMTGHFDIPEDLQKYHYNINFSRIHDEDDIEDLLAQTIEMNRANMEEAGRGTITLAEIERRARAGAQAAGMSVGKFLRGWENGPTGWDLAEQINICRMFVQSSGVKLKQLSREVQISGSTEARFLMRRQLAIHNMLLNKLSGATREIARAQSAQRIMARGLKDQKKQIEEILRNTPIFQGEHSKWGTTISDEKLAAMLDKLDGLDQVSSFVDKAYKATTFDLFFTAYVNALLTALGTHSANLTGTGIKMFFAFPERYLAGWWGKAIPGEDLGNVQPEEMMAMGRGISEGAKDAFRLLGKVFMDAPEVKKWGLNDAVRNWYTKRTGKELGLGEGPMDDVFTRVEFQKPNPWTAQATGLEGTKWGEFIDIIGGLVNSPTRALGTADIAMKAFNYRLQLHALATRKVLAEGLTGDAAAQRYQDILLDPPEDIHIGSIDYAREMTFTQELGDVARAGQKFINKSAVMRMIMLFYRTGVNIGKDVVGRTPLAVATRALYKRGPEGDMARAKATLGSMICLAVGSMVFEGRVSGFGSRNKNVRKNKEDMTGWKQYSWNVGDRYIQYSRLDPVGGAIGLAADVAEIILQAQEMDEGDEAVLDEALAAVTLAIGQNLSSKLYLRRFSETINAFSTGNVDLPEDPEEARIPSGQRRFWSSLAGSLIPAVVAQAARHQDPIMREAETMVEKLKSRLPWLSETLEAERDIFGEVVMKNEPLGPDILSPVYSSKEKNDPIGQEIARLKLGIGVPGKTIEGIELTGEQRTEFQILAGGKAREEIEKYFRSSEFKKHTDEARKRKIKQIFYGTRRDAKGEMIDKHKDLKLKIEKLKREEEKELMRRRIGP